MLKKIIYSILILIIFSNLNIINADNKELIIWTIERKPFSYQENWKWTWFSIELWEKVAEKNNLNYSYIEYKKFSDMLDSTKNWKNNMSVANISITLEREKNFDFSTPIFDSWLNILWLSNFNEITSFTWKYMKYVIKAIIYISIILFSLTHFFWIFNIIKWNLYISSYFSDIFQIFTTIISQFKNTFWLKILISFIFIFSIFIVSFFSEKITLIFNKNKSYTSVNENNVSYKEIKNKKIWVTKKSTAMNFLNSKNIQTENYDYLNDLYKTLEEWNIDYIVADEPILKYYSKNNNLKIFNIIWKTFNPENFWFLYPNNSNLKEKIDITILELKEDWSYNKIYNKYF
jgi:polar amino acid transport system substrate-binding protein